MSAFNFTEAFKTLCVCRNHTFSPFACTSYEKALGHLPYIQETMEKALTHVFAYTTGMARADQIRELHDTIAATKVIPTKAFTVDTERSKPNKNHNFYFDVMSLGRSIGAKCNQTESPIDEDKRDAFFEKIAAGETPPPDLSDWVSIQHQPENLPRLLDIVNLYLGEN